MANQPLEPEFGKHRQGLFNQFLRWLGESADAKIDDIKPVEPEVAEVVMRTIEIAGVDVVKPRFTVIRVPESVKPPPRSCWVIFILFSPACRV